MLRSAARSVEVTFIKEAAPPLLMVLGRSAPALASPAPGKPNGFIPPALDDVEPWLDDEEEAGGGRTTRR